MRIDRNTILVNAPSDYVNYVPFDTLEVASGKSCISQCWTVLSG